MRGVGGVVAALVIAATHQFCAGTSSAHGNDRRDGETLLVFFGTDFWRHGAFAHGGLLWSPAGLDAEGFTFKLLVNGGLYRYRSGALGNVEVTGRQFSGFLAPGWRFKRDDLTLTVFAGLDLQEHRLSPDDPGARLRGGTFGARFGAELWYQPNAATMVAADVSVSTIGGNYTARAATGWRVFDRLYLGPEVQALQSNNYRQFRVGAHATAFKTEQFEWSAAAGWVLDSDHRTGAYGRLGLIARQ